MKNKINKRIIQIMPSNGWKSVYVEEENKIVEYDLVCWALVQVTEIDEFGNKEEYTQVEGVDGGDMTDFCQSASNFLGYQNPQDSFFYEGKVKVCSGKNK